MSGFVLGSILAFTSSPPSAKLSFRRPQSPLGSAAVMAIPAIVTLSRRSFHSSGVKFDLSVMSTTPLTFLLSGLLLVHGFPTAETVATAAAHRQHLKKCITSKTLAIAHTPSR